MRKFKVYRVSGWVYKYDAKNLVWRALHIIESLEINQFHKLELLFLMGHRDDSITWNHATLTRVPVLSMEEWANFIEQ